MILQIANDFTGSKVYKSLFIELDNQGVDQVVYTAIRGENGIGRNEIEFKCQNSKIIYSPILNWYIDRVFYRNKIEKIFKDLLEKVNIKDITFIHAHTWYSDGGVAYLLHKRYNIPYSVAVRNTDLNLFFKYFIHQRSFGFKILNNSKSVFTISDVYTKRLKNILEGNKHGTQCKVQLIPNGIDSFWLKDTYIKRISLLNNNVIKLIYVGKFTRSKNVINLMKAIRSLNEKSELLFHLSIVGGGGNCENEVFKYLKENENEYCFTYYGQIIDKEELKNIYRINDVFAMPSLHETFGLVYVEAMTQGLPILYTNNEGIDGFYEESIGEKVDNGSVEEIVDRLNKMSINYTSYEIPVELILRNHNWKEIAKKYVINYLE